MMGRQQTLLSFIFLLLAANPTLALNTAPLSTPDSFDAPCLDVNIKLGPIGAHRYRDANNWLNSVTAYRATPGSLVIRYEGVQRLLVRQARSQERWFIRMAVRHGWYVRPEVNDFSPLFNSQAESDWDGHNLNGAWWSRSWLDSRTPENGGAPYRPYVHTTGKETTLNLGPLSITNELNVRLDYVGLFEVNPNPVPQNGEKRAARLSVDVRPLPATNTTRHAIRFSVRPRVRIGVPRAGSWQELLRGASLRGAFEISHLGRRIIAGDVAVKWSPERGVTVIAEVALVSW